MKIQIASDLHIDQWPRDDFPRLLDDMQTDADVLVLAGDCVSLTKRDIAWSMARLGDFTERYPRVVFVPGNHEFYGTSIQEGFENLHEFSKQLPKLLSLVVARSAAVKDQRFIGGTLWQPPAPNEHKITDHYLIKNFESDAAHYYEMTQACLEVCLKEGDVVVTHHAPSLKSLAPEFVGNPCNRWFITPEVEPLLIERKPKLWIHGHTHTPFDYVLGATRVVCSPRGYPGEGVRFNPKLVVEI